jgi:hypothetical protein
MEPILKGDEMDESLSPQEFMKEHHPDARLRQIHIFVEVNGRNKRLQFDSSPVTGRQIREEAGVPLTDDLTRLIHGKPSGGNIGLDDPVDIHNGDHFIALPTGTVS